MDIEQIKRKNNSIEINITRLEKYFEKYSYPINCSFNVGENTTPHLIIIKGALEQNGGTHEFFDFTDFQDILIENNILGVDGLLKKENENFEKDIKEGRPFNRERADNMEKLVYLTLVKYITQVLEASLGQNLFPEIIPLQKHKDFFHKK